ncbi:MAG: hydrogenase maturation nickel metallochaperone HypA [Syntrophomonas sp.]
MHELALIESVLTMVKENAQTNNIKKITIIKLVVGKFSMAVPESLQFAFEAFKDEEMFAEAVLEIKETPIICQCKACGHEFEVDDTYRFKCSQCGDSSIEIISGRELYVDYYEGE